MIRITPKEGLKVINPETLKRLPKDGIVIRKMDTFWKRREKDGDITVEKLTVKKPQKKEEKGK